MKNGLTLIELLLVIAIVAILAATTTPFLSRFVLQTTFDTTEEKIISQIRKAQEYSMDGRNDETWGICITDSNLKLYSGTCSTPSISENFSIPSSVNISGLSDTTFNLRGEPSVNLSIIVSSDLESSTIELNSAGGLTVQ